METNFVKRKKSQENSVCFINQGKLGCYSILGIVDFTFPFLVSVVLSFMYWTAYPMHKTENSSFFLTNSVLIIPA